MVQVCAEKKMVDSSGILIWICKGRAPEEVCAGSYVMDRVVCLSYKLYFLDLRKLGASDFDFSHEFI